MAPDKLKPNDPRVQSKTATVRGKTYHYLHGKPEGKQVGTILLVHGFPDLSLGWRYQVPLLQSMGLQVIVPDMLGYGGTDAPQELEKYSLKSMCDDMADLVAQIVPGEQIFLGGHDWGGALVWRLVLWHPELIKAVFSVCTPYAGPRPHYIDMEAFTTSLPNFKYQIQLAGPDVERELGSDPAKIRGFLTGIYGGRGPNGEQAFTTTKGVAFEHLDKMNPGLLSQEEVDYYVEQYSRNGVRGPLNWYRTRKINFEEELALLKDGQQPIIKTPALVVMSTNDAALPPFMATGMENYFENLRKTEVLGTHWSLLEDANVQVNAEIKSFIEANMGSAPVKAQI